MFSLWLHGHKPTHPTNTCMRCLPAQYNSYSTHYRETDCLREMIEPFMRATPLHPFL